MAAMAAWTFATVRSGFFPPFRQLELCQEQMADGAQDEVPLDRAVLADLGGRVALGLEAGIAGRAAHRPLAGMASVADRRPPGPDPKRGEQFRHLVLAQGVQTPQKRLPP